MRKQIDLVDTAKTGLDALSQLLGQPEALNLVEEIMGGTLEGYQSGSNNFPNNFMSGASDPLIKYFAKKGFE